MLKSVSNCPFDCSYCFLQNYLNDDSTSVISDIDALMSEVEEMQNKYPWRFLRIGTWELGDSLALENQTGQAKQLINRFSSLSNVVLELKTKSDCVDSILSLNHKNKTVVSWSLNPDLIIDYQEHRTASLSQRLNAIKKVVSSGYLVGFHFDPMIFYDDWETGYSELLDKLFEIVPIKQIAWISVGSLRFNPEMKDKMKMNFPMNKLHLQEMTLGKDGKVRYVKPNRLMMYRFMYKKICELCNTNNLSPIQENVDLPLFYFCMERWDVWESIIGESPQSINHLDYLFAKNFSYRFDSVTTLMPNLDQYLQLKA